jgi:hypothetical protein
MNNNELSTETIKLIRKSIRERLADHASDYKIRKVIKAHLENPCGWSAGKDDESRDELVQRYYRNIGNTSATSIFLDFKDSVLRSFGIYA